MPYIGQRPSKGDENNFKILDDISSYTLTFDGSDSSIVSAANDTITSLTHRFVQGQRVTYNKGGGTVIPGLSDGVYFIIKEDHNTIKLATSASNAANGTAVNITNVGGGASHTLNVAFDGVNTKFKATHTNGQKTKITRSAQLVISINGVIQQPHDSATPSTGFGFDLDGTIVFSQAPVSTDVFWAHVLTNNNVTFDISNNDIDNFTGDGSTREFNLSKTPPDNRNVLVTIDGVIQYPNDPDGTVRSYSVVENVLTFVTAPDSGVEIQVRHIGFAGSTSGSGGVTSFYGRTGAVVLKNTDNITVNDATIEGDLTVNGDLTTLNTTLREVELLHVDANSSTTAGIITQRGSGDILNLFDNNSEVLTVTDGGQVGINSTSPSNGAILDIGVPTTMTGGLDSTVSIASTDNKTYPNAASFNVTLGLKQEIEVGGTQTINSSTPGGFNFITGITNWMRKKNDNVQDVERSYYAGLNQNFTWTDENTLKQYTGITDSIAYFGKDANGRTTDYIIAKQIYLNPGDGNTATINQAYGQELRFQNFSGGTTPTANVTNWSGFRPSLNWFLLGGNYNGTTTDAMFYDTSPTWGVTAVAGGAANYTITNLYGLRLRPPGNSTGLTITNNYGISQEWSSATNYFAGKVGIGITNPDSYQSSSDNLVVGNTGDAAGITIRSGTNNGGYITFANAGSGAGLYKSRIAYDHQGDKLTFSTNGTNRLFIKGSSATDGRVGINTLSPYAPLDVFHNGSATYKDMIMARSHSGGFAVQCSNIDASNPTWTLRTYALEDMIISPGGTGVNNHKVFIRASDGHIGINTTIPNKLVTIKAISPVVRIEAADSSDKRLDLMVSNVGIATISAEQSNQQLSLKTTSGEVRINKDGAVGINTATPINDFTLLTDGNGYVDFHGSGGKGAEMNVYKKDDKSLTYKFANNGGANELAQHYLTNASGKYLWYIGGTSTANEKMRLDNNGRLGIGTISPTHVIHSYGSGVLGGVRFENSHDTTTVSGNTAANAFPHNLILSNYSGLGSANDRMVSIGFDVPTTGTYANATIAYQATSAGTGDLQFHLESSNTISEKIRFTSAGQIVTGNPVTPAHNQIASLIVLSANASSGANMLSDSSAIYNHTNPSFLAVQNRYDTGTGQESGIILSQKHIEQGSWAIYGKRTGSYVSDLIFRNRTGASASAERVRIDSSGRMMIGNQHANNMFSGADDLVVGNTSGAHGITIITSDSTVGRLLFSDSTSQGAATYQGQINFNHSNDRLDLRTYTDGTITLCTDNTERIFVQSDGRVVINSSGTQPSTTVSGYQFDAGGGYLRISQGGGATGTSGAGMSLIGGGSNTNHLATTSWGSNIYLINSNQVDNNANALVFANKNSLASSMIVGKNDSHTSRNGSLIFATSLGSSPTQRMRITKEGSINIGTDSTQSTHMLYMQGTGDVGIHLRADTDNVDENHNPYLSMAQDSGNTQAFKLGMAGDANTAFNMQLANSPFIHANNANSQPLQLAHMTNMVVTISNVPTLASTGASSTDPRDFDSNGSLAGSAVGGMKIHRYGNNTAAALMLSGHNNTGTPGTETRTQLTHDGANLKFHIEHHGYESFNIGPTGNIYLKNCSTVPSFTTSYNVSAISLKGGSLMNYQEDNIYLTNNLHYDGSWKNTYAGGGGMIAMGSGAFHHYYFATDSGAGNAQSLIRSVSFYKNNSAGSSLSTGNRPSYAGTLVLWGHSNATTAGGIEFHTSGGGGGGYGGRITCDSNASMRFHTRNNNSAWSTPFAIDGPSLSAFFSGSLYVRSEFNMMSSSANASKYMDIGFQDNSFFMRRTAYNDGNHATFLTVNNSLVLSGDFNDTSDAKLKKNVATISDGAIEDIKKLRPVTFDWIDDTKNDNVSGFIAQEVKEVLPNLVDGTEYDPTLNDSEKGTKGGIKSEGYSINSIGVTAHLTKALQEAIAKIEVLESKVAALEGS